MQPVFGLGRAQEQFSSTTGAASADGMQPVSPAAPRWLGQLMQPPVCGARPHHGAAYDWLLRGPTFVRSLSSSWEVHMGARWEEEGLAVAIALSLQP